LLNEKAWALSGHPEGSLLAAVTATENEFELVGTLKRCVSFKNTGHLEGIACRVS
jgi:hypothetical protein